MYLVSWEHKLVEVWSPQCTVCLYPLKGKDTHIKSKPNTVKLYGNAHSARRLNKKGVRIIHEKWGFSAWTRLFIDGSMTALWRDKGWNNTRIDWQLLRHLSSCEDNVICIIRCDQARAIAWPHLFRPRGDLREVGLHQPHQVAHHGIMDQNPSFLSPLQSLEQIWHLSTFIQVQPDCQNKAIKAKKVFNLFFVDNAYTFLI